MQSEALMPGIVFLCFCVLGFLLGAVYDIFRILRLAVKTPKWVVFLEDFLYFSIAAAVTFIAVLYLNSGVVRLYVFIGEALGFIIYHFSVGILVINIAGLIIKIVKLILGLVYKVVSFPFVMVYRYVYRKNRKVFLLLSLNIKKLLEKLKFSLKKNKTLMYNDSKIREKN